MGRIIPYIMENNKCLKPRPTSSDPQNSVSFGSIHVNLLDGNLIREGSHQKKTIIWKMLGISTNK
jgi:hypothetical protein